MTRRGLLALAARPRAAPSILVHEHVLVDFTGGGRYDADEVFRLARPRLAEVAALGCRRFQDCTPAFLGRDPRLLARLSDAAGIEIWTNTGAYGAASQRYVPAAARAATAADLAAGWIREARSGVDLVRPRFIKTGVNRAPLDALDRKLVRAAAIASRETGLTIASHTGDGAGALEQIAILAEENLPPERFVWVHAQSERDHAVHARAARSGAWVEFDGIAPKTAGWHLECLAFMAENGLLGRTLISQDSGWYHVGEPGGGVFRGYAYLYTDFLPRLKPAWRRPLMWDNPRRAFGA